MKFNLKSIVGGESLKRIYHEVAEEVREKSPRILAGGAVVGLGASVYFVWKARPKCDEILADRKKRLEEVKEEYSDPDEVKKETARVNIDTAGKMVGALAPVVVSVGLTGASIIAADRINYRRLVAATTMYDISNEALMMYKKKMKDVVGEEKAEEVKAEVNNEVVAKHPLEERFVYSTGKGDMIYLDVWTGRYFRSSRGAIESAVNIVNYRMNNGEMFISLNEFYDLLGLPEVKFGEEWGFDVNKGLLDPDYPSHGVTPDGSHCMMLDYDIYTRSRFGDY